MKVNETIDPVRDIRIVDQQLIEKVVCIKAYYYVYIAYALPYVKSDPGYTNMCHRDSKDRI